MTPTTATTVTSTSTIVAAVMGPPMGLRCDCAPHKDGPMAEAHGRARSWVDKSRGTSGDRLAHGHRLLRWDWARPRPRDDGAPTGPLYRRHSTPQIAQSSLGLVAGTPGPPAAAG